ncbi:hypothetical protein ACGFNU_02035 [Spirillospora sp. NPDC048911]|uniref:hypothetical protein n=1 Tax=Spirillospora sp. NPDC048911 TaxID=3364527 RepID=UPI0037198233
MSSSGSYFPEGMSERDAQRVVDDAVAFWDLICASARADAVVGRGDVGRGDEEMGDDRGD